MSYDQSFPAMFVPFQQLIPRTANVYGIGREMEAAKICHDFRTLVPEIFEGKPDAAEKVTPGHFKNAILVVNVSSPAWAQEVIMRKTKIIAEMNEKAGKEVIKNLRTQLPR